MALGKITRAKSLPQTKNRGQPLTLTAHQGGLSVMAEFSEACRKDLAARATAIR